MDITRIRTPGLGDSTYVIVQDDLAIVVDPQRDIDRFDLVLEESGAGLAFVLETHVHNDYLSGARALARRHGSELIMPAAAAPAYCSRPAFHLENIDGGPITIRPIHTPGHTPEHTAYLLFGPDGDDGGALFSGGSLLVGSAGRPDLLGPERSETLAHLQFGSIRRLGSLPPSVGVYPTHGAGSFCTTSAAGSGSSTIGEELATNPLVRAANEEDFVSAQLDGLRPYPAYYERMGPMNLMGPPDAPRDLPPQLTARQLAELEASTIVVDTRSVAEFAAGHIPGSVSVELRTDFGSWVGWTLSAGPIALILDEVDELDEATRQLWRVGLDEVQGWHLGLGDWEGPVATHRVAAVSDLVEAVANSDQILDVRSAEEWDRGVIPGSKQRYLPDLLTGVDDILSRESPVLVVCGSGYRASIAASLLERSGFEPIVLDGAGVDDVLRGLAGEGAI